MGRRHQIPREVFLSHASADRAAATMIADTLRAHGVPVWYSRTHLRGAQQWHDEIGRALRRCDWFIVLLSPASVKSRWVRRELLFALNARQFEDRIVPVLLRPCRTVVLSWTLDALQRVDCEADVRAGLADLLRVWGLRLDRRKTGPGRRSRLGRRRG